MHRKKLDLQKMLLCKTITAETGIIQLLSIDRNVFLCITTPTLCWLLYLEVIAAAWKTVLGCLPSTCWKMEFHSLNAAPPAKCADLSLQLYWLKSIMSSFINSSVTAYCCLSCRWPGCVIKCFFLLYLIEVNGLSHHPLLRYLHSIINLLDRLKIFLSVNKSVQDSKKYFAAQTHEKLFFLSIQMCASSENVLLYVLHRAM